VVKLNVTPAGQLTTKTPAVNGILPVTTPCGQVGGVNPGAKLGPVGFIPNKNVKAGRAALKRVRKKPTGAAGAAAASTRVNGVDKSAVADG
jgi:hypothetical protein